jgi:hypothetical protein
MDETRWPPSERTTLRLVVALLASLAVLQVSDRHIAMHAPGVLKLDLRFGWDLATAMEVLGAFGAGGRRAYLINLAIDTVFPALAAAATVALVARTFPRRQVLLSIAPIAFFVLDAIENAGLATMTARFPDVGADLAAFTRWATMTKLSTLPIWVPTSIVALIVLLLRRRR